MGKREYLNDKVTGKMLKELNSFFDSMVEIPRMKVGRKQSIETLINEEALLLAKFLREKRNHGVRELVFDKKEVQICLRFLKAIPVDIPIRDTTAIIRVPIVETLFWLRAPIDRKSVIGLYAREANSNN